MHDFTYMLIPSITIIAAVFTLALCFLYLYLRKQGNKGISVNIVRILMVVFVLLLLGCGILFTVQSFIDMFH
jgi:ABC-type Fe3+ transport system permease subunit